MKTFLNVLGALAAVASVGVMLLGGQGAESVGLGFSGLVLAGFMLGLAKVIELLQAEHAAAERHRALEVEFWKLMAQAQRPAPPPTLPGRQP